MIQQNLRFLLYMKQQHPPVAKDAVIIHYFKLYGNYFSRPWMVSMR